MYDLASAVMYAGGQHEAAALVDAYLAQGVLDRFKVERTLAPMLTGIDGPRENEQGLEDAWLGLTR